MIGVWKSEYLEIPATGEMIEVFDGRALVKKPQVYRFDLYSPIDGMAWVGQFASRSEAESYLREVWEWGEWTIIQVDYTGELGDVAEGKYNSEEMKR
jgi:hypothetical protein